MGGISGEYAGHGRIGTFSASRNCGTDPCDMGMCIIMLKHEVMAADKWHENGPQDLVMVSLCIQIVVDKMQLCLLSVAHACPYNNPTAPLFTTLTTANQLQTQRHTHGLRL